MAEVTTKKKALPKTEAEPKKARADWEAIERDYRLGKLTLREMADKHGVSNGRIAQVASQKGWTRGDLKKAVRQATTALLVANDVAAEVSKAKQSLSDSVIATAEQNKQVVLRHRDRAQKAIDVTMRMLAELDSTTTKPEQLEQLFALATQEVTGLTLIGLQQAFKDFMRLHARVGSAHKLMDALHKAQNLEAQSYGNLYDEGAKQPDELENLTDEELNFKLRTALTRLGIEAPAAA